MRKIVAAVIMVVMLIPALFILPASDATAGDVKAEVGSGKFVETSLYFYHNESESDYRMNTTPPPSGDANTSSLKDGESVEFKSPELDEDLSINTTENCTISFYIEITVPDSPATAQEDTINVKLTFSVEELDVTGEDYFEKTTGTTEVEGRSINLGKTDIDEIERNSQITLNISSTVSFPAGTGVYTQQYYTVTLYYGNAERSSHLSFYSSPVTLGNIVTYDYNEERCSEFKPNVLPPKSEIIFKGDIKDAFGDEDLKEVRLDIEKPEGGVIDSIDLDVETGNYECSWDYSDSSLKAGEYAAVLKVRNVQDIVFTQTANFNFSACGLEAWANRTFERVLVGKHADYTVTIRNTGADEINLKLTVDIAVRPVGSHLWNITLIDREGEESVNVTSDANREHIIYFLQGGTEEKITLIVSSSNISEEEVEESRCTVGMTATPIKYPEESVTVPNIQTCLVAPYEINLVWEKLSPPLLKKGDTYYALVNMPYQLDIGIANLGGNLDTVNLTLDYSNHDIWNITLETETVENLFPFGYDGSYREIKLTVKASSSEPDKKYDTVINITGESVNAPLEYKEKFGNRTYKYLTLNLSRAFGINLNVLSESEQDVDVKDSSDQATYELKVETNDNTTHTVKLNAVPANKNINTTIPESVSVNASNSPKNVTLTVTCPQGMLAGDYTITIKASIKGAPVPEHNRTVNVTVTVKPFPALSVKWAGSNSDKIITVTAKPGEYVNRDLTVINNGNSEIPEVSIMSDSKLFDNAVPGQFALLPGEEKTVTVSLYVPADARNGDTFAVEVNASYGKVSDDATIIIKAEQGWWETLINTLYSMIYFIILLIAVIVAFIALWVKRR